MGQFQFKEGLVLDFGAVQYEVRPDDPDFLEVYETECRHCAELGDKLKTYPEGRQVEAIRDACNGVTTSIDRILGEGAVAEIFSGRAIGFYDLIDVFSYITQETNAYRERRRPDIAPAPANREQRRAAAKKVSRPAAGEEK